MAVCYIISAGDCSRIDIEKQDGDMIIAADAGMNYCIRDNIIPDVIIGDFDSLGKIPESESVITLPVEKDDTDTSFAVKYAMSKGYDKFVIFGATGGKRQDHTFANITLLGFISKNNGIGFLVSDDYTITSITDSKLIFDSKLSGNISVFSFLYNILFSC